MPRITKILADVKGVLLLGSLTLLASCQTAEIAGPPILNGSWASTDGVYTAQFQNGNFQAVANDTGGVISRGEYVALSADRIKIKWIGLVSGTSNEADCNKPDPNRLDCLDINGNRFSLVRNS